MDPNHRSFVEDDLKFRCYTTLLHALKVSCGVSQNSGNPSGYRAQYQQLLGAAVLLARDGEDVACLPRRTKDEIVLFTGCAPEAGTGPSKDNPYGSVVLTSGATFQWAEINLKRMVEFIVDHW